MSERTRGWKISGIGGWLAIRGLLVFTCLLVANSMAADASVATEPDLVVKVERRAEQVIVDAKLVVEASPPVVWGVLTDFDHMASFISNLQSSSAKKLGERSFEISQKGRATYGPLSFAFETVRIVELVPPETIRSRQISGTTKSFEGLTRVVFESGRAEISYHGESVPGVWIPPVVGLAFIRNQTEEQFREIRAEMLRRQQTAAP